MQFKGKQILITGGTGTFGRKLVELLLSEHRDLGRIIIFSRDEYKQHEMAKRLSSMLHLLKFVLGDVRDITSLRRAAKDVEILIHAAALKQIDTAEANPSECIATNIHGTANVIAVADELGIEQVMLLSTDKAVSPSGVYGATKMCAEKLFLEANQWSNTHFTVIRFGNIMGSRGSVLEYFIERKKTGSVAITDPEMYRFAGTDIKLCRDLIYALSQMKGGEIFISKLPSFRLLDLARAVYSKFEIQYKGVRPGEKYHEELIGANEPYQKIELKDFYVLISDAWKGHLHDYLIENEGVRLPSDFVYTTESIDHLLTEEELQIL